MQTKKENVATNALLWQTKSFNLTVISNGVLTQKHKSPSNKQSSLLLYTEVTAIL